MRRHNSFFFVWVAASVTVVSSLTIPATNTAEIPKNSTPCTIDVEKLCPNIEEELSNYTIDIGTHFFKESRELQVKIHSTSCPWHIQTSPWWYQLHVVRKASTSDDKEENHGASTHEDEGLDSGEGAFLRMRLDDEIQLCDSNKRVVFTSCSPSPMDFPVMFVWKTSTHYNTSDSICFKLLLKWDGSTACKQIQVCRSVAQLLSNTTSSFTVENTIPRTTNITLEDIIGESAENQPESHNMKTVLDIDMPQATESTISMSGCMSTKKFLHDSGISWVPSCDCKGHYKRIQCQKAEHDTQVCWCSSKGGSEKFNTRRTLTCSTATDFEC